MELKTYPKIYNVGYRGFERIFQLPVVIQEKLDGSNVSIHRTQDGLLLASRNKWLVEQSSGDFKMFSKFVTWVKDREEKLIQILEPGDAIWGEFCDNHNVMKYDRTEPFIAFDFSKTDKFGNRRFINPFHMEPDLSLKLFNCGILFIMSVSFPVCPGKDSLDSLLREPSMLGGRREGVVIKNYDELAVRGEVCHEMFVKYVNPEFKEQAKVVWNIGESIEETIVKTVYNEARLRKGIQRLKEEGRLHNGPPDIGPLIGIVNQDIHAECQEYIKQILFDKHWKNVSRIVTSKVVRDYKAKLQEAAFNSSGWCQGPSESPTADSGPELVGDSRNSEIT